MASLELDLAKQQENSQSYEIRLPFYWLFIAGVNPERIE